MRRESEKKIRQKIEDEAKLRRLMEKNLEQERDDYIQNYIKEKLNEIIEDDLKKLKVNLSNKIKGKLRTEQIKLIDKTKEKLNESKDQVDKKLEEIWISQNAELQRFKTNLETKLKEFKTNLETESKRLMTNLETESTKVTRQQFLNLKSYRSMESELRKVQSAVILIPIFLVAFSVFFKERIDDIMSIDALQTEIKYLQEDVKALQPTREHGARQPWEEPPPPWEDVP